MKYLLNTYQRLPVSFTHGQGVWLFDDVGNRYLDAIAGVAVVGLGHAHPRISDTICQQAKSLMHTSNIYQIPLQEALAEKLCKLSGAAAAFFNNSGAEANESAIKLARLYGHQQGIDKPTIVVMDKAFHGRTLATLSASGTRKIQAGFEPLVSGFVRCPYNDIDALQSIAEANQSIVAVMIEPIQGEGGIQIPDGDYLTRVRELCDRFGWLLILDEIQTGNGRTGTYFAFQHMNIKPDIVTTAKGLGNGFPIGACLAFEKTTSVFQPGNHGSTFGGNPLASAVGIAVIDEIDHSAFYQSVAQKGELLKNSLQTQLSEIHGVKSIRGMGLMVGIELDRPCGELMKMALEERLLINVTSDTVIRLLPPLIIEDKEIIEISTKLSQITHQFLLTT